ncbi:MAG: oligosaccharide flippase family protein, partial [Bacilli bacterium]
MKNITKNILFKNIIILLVSGAIAKVLGMFSKIILTRTAGINTISLYTLVTPTLMLFISICQFSFPISISKLSAEEKYDNNCLLKNAYLISWILSALLIIIIITFSRNIAFLLHNRSLYKPISALALIIPLVSISSIQRGFLHGKEDMMPGSITNVLEEIIKIVLIILVIPIAILNSNITAVVFIVIFNLISELINIIIMGTWIKKKYHLSSESKYSKKVIKDILNISIPTTFIRLISSVGFFLEPIILTYVLLKTGYSSNYVKLEYGVINAYIIPILSIPIFFSGSIASALLPNLTKLYATKCYKNFNKKIIQMMILSMVIGVLFLIIILAFPGKILSLLYNVNFGINYLYLIGPFFIILYIQPVLSVSLQAMN